MSNRRKLGIQTAAVRAARAAHVRAPVDCQTVTRRMEYPIPSTPSRAERRAAARAVRFR